MLGETRKSAQLHLENRGYAKAFEDEIKGVHYDMYFGADSVEAQILYFDSENWCQEMVVTGDLHNLDNAVQDLAGDPDMERLGPGVYQHLPSYTIWMVECDDREHVYFIRVKRAPTFRR